MDMDSAYISKIEFLKPQSRLHVALTALCVCLHAVAAIFYFNTIGEPYRLVVEELTKEALVNGTVITVESLQSTEDRPIPSETAPNPVAIITLMISVGLHVLVVLVQRWSVKTRMLMQFTKLKSIRARPSHVCVYPPDYRGKPEIVALERASEGLNSHIFSFQRRKFEISEEGVKLLSFPIEQVIESFISSNKGLTDAAEIKKRQSLYGMNAVDIPVPPFWRLYLDQLLSPIPIFQLFCSALWMMDEYWKYTVFTLLSIFGFEVSTTVQRKRSLETLRSMSAKSVVPVQVLRSGSWTSLSSDQLVPGDRIRLGGSATVPCDCLIVNGSAVVNEATLTGESVPQMKDAIDADRKEILDINGRDRIHCLFSGTCLVRADEQIELITLRTGSQSSQGELLRMVEFSQQAVSGDKKDTMYLLLLLLMFALAAAGYVVYERITGTGSENLTRMKTHKLMLRVIMIITSVVPPELPMQLSLSVNTALIALNKIGILCTEPFRVPMAGTVTGCFFDKTGTLTSDHLQCHGFSSVPSSPVDQTKVDLVIAGCHSLVSASQADTSKLIGDPIEQTALEKIGFKYNPVSSAASSPDGKREIKILTRFHFSSALQRMSCIVLDRQAGTSPRTFGVVKGSPEMILTKLTNKDAIKTEYVEAYEKLAHGGMRVLALAVKEVTASQHYHRDEIEKDLTFVGFASFACETRGDSKTVISALSDAAELRCVMVTGDAALTSIHVAKQVGICRHEDGDRILRLSKNSDEKYVWESLGNRKIPFISSDCAKLRVDFDLVISGDVLPADESSEIWTHAVAQVCVFARMSPQQKERVISMVRTLGGRPLMCGDGGNDVGALKQADVGVALLVGFGAANTENTLSLDSEDAEESLEKQAHLQQLKEKHLSAKMKAEFAIKKKELMQKQQAWLQLEIAKPNNGGYWNCIKLVTARMREELNVEAKKLQSKYGLQTTAWNATSQAATAASAQEDKPPTAIQMGDASVAAPFTSRSPSIRSVIQIIKQGRCTLLVAVQMMQIMMLESLISAYTFAAITMEGGRSTEIQMIGSSVFVMVASIAFTYAKPARKLSSVIPLKSVFHPAIFVSVILQVMIHLAVLVSAMSWAKAEMGESALSDLYAFERDRDEKLTKLMDANEQEGSSWFAGGAEIFSMFKSVPYRPNLLNTVMFLVKTAQQVAVLVVNYKGSPWMQGAMENRALFLSMFACALGIIVCSTGYIPWLNDMLELLVLPSELRKRVLILLGLSTVGTFVTDRLVVFAFAPKIFFASTVKPLMETGMQDLVPLAKTCMYLVAGVLVLPLVLGNPVGMIGGFFAFKQYRKWQADKEMEELKTKCPELFDNTQVAKE